MALVLSVLSAVRSAATSSPIVVVAVIVRGSVRLVEGVARNVRTLVHRMAIEHVRFRRSCLQS